MKKLMYLMLLPLALVACENIIPVDFGEVETKLVLNAQLKAADGEQVVYLSESSLTMLGPVHGADVTVQVDGQAPVKAVESDDLELDRRYAGAYCFQGGFPAGSKVTVRASLGSLEVSASSDVMPKPTIIQVDTLRTAVQDFSYSYVSFQWKITMKDQPGDNFYRVGVLAESNIRLVDAQGQTVDVPSVYELRVSGANDPVLGGSSSMGTSLFDLEPTYLVFTDEMFRDGEYTLHLSLPADNLQPFYYAYDEKFQPVYSITQTTLIPWLESITQEEYFYLAALNNLENFGYEAQMIVEPTTLPANVEGGLGFVSVLNRTEAAPLQLPPVKNDFSSYYE